MVPDLASDSLHNHPGYGCDGAPFRIVERALRVIQTGQWPDLLLRNGGLVGGLEVNTNKEVDWRRKYQETADWRSHFYALIKGCLLQQ